MTNFKDWNYEKMGFKSEDEMKESIARVERRMKLSDVELKNERRRKAQSVGIDFAALKEGARLRTLDQAVYSRLLYEKEQAKLQAEQEEMQSLLNAVAEHMTAEKEAAAQKEMQKGKEKLEAELQKEIYSKHGVKTDQEKKLDDAYSKLLGN